jgi:hypothetical protein
MNASTYRAVCTTWLLLSVMQQTSLATEPEVDVQVALKTLEHNGETVSLLVVSISNLSRDRTLYNPWLDKTAPLPVTVEFRAAGDVWRPLDIDGRAFLGASPKHWIDVPADSVVGGVVNFSTRYKALPAGKYELRATVLNMILEPRGSALVLGRSERVPRSLSTDEIRRQRSWLLPLATSPVTEFAKPESEISKPVP